MYTRKQRLSNEVSHRNYYAQFVNDDVKENVINSIGIKALLKSKDEHLNDISMTKWDRLGGYAWHRTEHAETCTMRPRSKADILPVDLDLLRQAKEVGENSLPSNATMVCIYKEAGKQIIEELKPNKVKLSKVSDMLRGLKAFESGSIRAEWVDNPQGKCYRVWSYKTLILDLYPDQAHVFNNKNYSPTTSTLQNMLIDVFSLNGGNHARN